ncbi:MAG: CRTAC1 family protein [Cyclobacteriaceae bacterium]|nr:CRTAC1 family protein [Cyclobacteriaceae bacterium SS2]
MRTFFYSLSISGCLLFGCTKSAEHTHSRAVEIEAKVKPDKQTKDMIQRVEKAYSRIDPENVQYIFNWERSEKLKERMDEMEIGAERNLVVYKYGEALLRAGEIDKAIDVFQSFHDFFEERIVPDQDKILVELKTQLAIAYLRKGELDNCLVNHNNESCIIPISEKAQHIDTVGSTTAIKYLNELLERKPFDFEIRYLLNIAYMTLGEYPQGVPIEFRIPEEYFAQSDFPKFRDVASDLGVNVDGMSGGISIDDFNNDGYLDMVVSAWGHDDQIRYFENNGSGGFNDMTAYSGLVGVTGGLNLKHADFNNDGFIDFIILRGAWLENYGKIPNSLIRNNGDGTFSDVTVETGIYSEHPTQTAVWADFNLDGWVDIFIANESTPNGESQCELFINNVGKTFTDVALEAGISKTGFFKGVASGDINNDGYEDIYLSNFSGENLLYINSSSEKTLAFKEAGNELGVSEPLQSFSTWIFDFNNDGFEDIFVSGYSTDIISPPNMLMANIYYPHDDELKKRRPKLYKNNGNGTFTDVAYDMGLSEPVTTMGCNFGDLDNDGFLDFYLATGDPSFLSIVPNKMYRNNRGQRFEDVTFSGGFGHIQKGHAVGFGDLDMDGDQDIYAVMGGAYEGDNYQNILFENPIGNANNWINISLEGKTSNRSAIGAKIVLTIEEDGVERKVFHTVGTGASFGGNSLLAEIGIGKATSIKKLDVHWPTQNKKLSSFQDVKINTSIKIVEEQNEIDELKLNKASFMQGQHHLN